MLTKRQCTVADRRCQVLDLANTRYAGMTGVHGVKWVQINSFKQRRRSHHINRMLHRNSKRGRGGFSAFVTLSRVSTLSNASWTHTCLQNTDDELYSARWRFFWVGAIHIDTLLTYLLTYLLQAGGWYRLSLWLASERVLGAEFPKIASGRDFGKDLWNKRSKEREKGKQGKMERAKKTQEGRMRELASAAGGMAALAFKWRSYGSAPRCKALVWINKVVTRRARLAAGWVTINSCPSRLSLAIPVGKLDE